MSNKLINDIKKLIVELKDEEAEAKKLERERPDNAAYFQGLSIGRMSARVSLECLIEEHGHHRPSCVESELRMRLHKIDIHNSASPIIKDFALGMHNLLSLKKGAIIVDAPPVDGAEAKEVLAQSVAVEHGKALTKMIEKYFWGLNKTTITRENVQFLVDIIPQLEANHYKIFYPNGYCEEFVRMGGYSSGNEIYNTKEFTGILTEWLGNFKYSPPQPSTHVTFTLDSNKMDEVTKQFLKDNGF